MWTPKALRGLPLERLDGAAFRSQIRWRLLMRPQCNQNQLVVLGISGLVLLANLASEEEGDCRVVRCHSSSSSSWQRQQFESYLKATRARKAASNFDKLPEYTSKDVAKRNGVDGSNGVVWMSYGGFVFDVTDFIPLHPGGTARISKAAGAAIEPFWYLHQQHYDTGGPLDIMQGLVVGRLAEKDQDLVDAELEKMLEACDSFQLELDLSEIGGGVMKLSLDDLKALPKTDQKGQEGCPQKTDRKPVITSIVGGVRMQELLSLSKAGRGPRLQITFCAMDGERVSTEVENYNDILVCYEMDGAPLAHKRGFPLRIIIPGRRVVKWVQRISVSEAPDSKKRRWFWPWGEGETK